MIIGLLMCGMNDLQWRAHAVIVLAAVGRERVRERELV
jgi:hypothetical protein